MSTSRFFQIAWVLVICLSSAFVSAAEKQHWSVQLVDDTAVLRATNDTEYKFVKATLTALQEAGTEKFSLRVVKPTDKTEGAKLTYSIKIIDGTAEITASTDLPYKYLETTISQLKDSGVEKFKFVITGKLTGEAASE